MYTVCQFTDVLSSPVATVTVNSTTTKEDSVTVEVCAHIMMPASDLDCPVVFPFDIAISTADDSAGKVISQ